MREIKFRFWNKLYKELWTAQDFIDNDYCLLANSRIQHSFFDDEYFDDFIIMQYTGLKDKNGVEIYEGDVVNLKNHTARYVVKYFDDDAFSPCGCYLFECLVTDEYRTMDYECEVVDNIYEKPELLKEQENG